MKLIGAKVVAAYRVKQAANAVFIVDANGINLLLPQVLNILADKRIQLRLS